MKCLVAILIAVGVAGAAEPLPEIKDLFGRTRPHGPMVNGAVVGLYAFREELLFGQPLAFELFALAPENLNVHMRLEYQKNVTLELTDGEGRAIPFDHKLNYSSAGAEGERIVFVLYPTTSSSMKSYWKPGKYTLKAIVEKKNDPTIPYSLPGKFHSNLVTFVVKPPGSKPGGIPLSEDKRVRLDKLIDDLQSDKESRLAAREALGKDRDPATYFHLVEKLRDAPRENRFQLRVALEPHNDWLHESVGPWLGARADFWLWLAANHEVQHTEWLRNRLGKNSGWDRRLWSTTFAEYAGITVPQDRPLTPAEEAALAVNLRSDDPATRLLAIRSVPASASSALRALLIEKLVDPYEYLTGFPDAYPRYPCREHAAQSIVRLGPAMIEPLLAFAERIENHATRHTVAKILGQLGPHPKSRSFLRTLLQSEKYEDQHVGIPAVAVWQVSGADLLRETLARPALHGNTRRIIVEALGDCGYAASDGPTLRRLLSDSESQVVGAAAKSIRVLRYGQALPDLERVARDVKADQNVRYEAVDAVIALADPKTTDQLLLDLADPKQHSSIRGHVYKRIGQRKIMAALPLLLDALSEKEGWTSTFADYGLRGLADLREGVGFDYMKNPDPKLWRDFWAKKSK